MKRLRIALAQINPLVGDLKGNSEKIIDSIEKLSRDGVELAVFPELAACGYPPEDLLFRPDFIKENEYCLKRIQSSCDNITAIIGFPHANDNKIYNSAAIIRNKKIICFYNKCNLPNYGVFDEKRYFTPGTECVIINSGDKLWSVNICEDIWVNQKETACTRALGQTNLLINISASPYHAGKILERENILRKRARQYNTTIAYCNLVGGQDELVFDGGSLIISPAGKVIARARQFEEDILTADIEFAPSKKQKIKSAVVKYINAAPLNVPLKPKLQPMINPPLKPVEEVYKALVLGTRDYILKNGFKKAVLGLSGGIDSALTCAIAMDALGKENVIGVSMPSQFTSGGTMDDARTLADNLGVAFITIPIKDVFDKYLSTLKPHFQDRGWDITEENIQARIRGNILMALSNKFGYLVLTTGNKSETSVGYCTLYGDMAGGFAVVKDVPKQLVYKLSKYRNERGAPIPQTVFTRPPTAELRENQKDSDSLPPYPVLDPIVEAYVEDNKSLSQIARSKSHKKIVERVINLIDRNEYKRRQAPPGIKITPKAFGKDRRMPITSRVTNCRG